MNCGIGSLCNFFILSVSERVNDIFATKSNADQDQDTIFQQLPHPSQTKNYTNTMIAVNQEKKDTGSHWLKKIPKNIPIPQMLMESLKIMKVVTQENCFLLNTWVWTFWICINIWHCCHFSTIIAESNSGNYCGWKHCSPIGCNYISKATKFVTY